MRAARVAYFPDSYHEVNGVAHTSRNFVAYAKRRELPFLCVRAGTRVEAVEQTGAVRTLELSRSRASVQIEKDLKFDAAFWRHSDEIALELERFRPDVIHVTGPSELGLFGAYFARRLGIPLAASWHTNLHEYASRRMGWLSPHLSRRTMAKAQHGVEASTLWLTAQFYRQAEVLFAPNRELCAMREDFPEATSGDDVELLTVSVDSFFSHKVWAEQENFQFSLLADFWPHGEVAKQYGVLRDGGFAERAVFIIDRNGTVRYIDIHAIGEAPDPEQVLEKLAEL